MKRVLTIQDISCLGKCSLTIALPIISALGAETVILPTAVLSTHTMFKNFTCKDLTDQIEPIINHWKSENVQFDAVYSGYLGTTEQINLCAEADIIVPNITEASLMTGMEYREEYDVGYIKELLSKLNQFGAGISVLTGVSLEEGKTGIMGFDRKTGEYFVYQNRKIDAAYHGTGDLFSSTCVGEILKGRDWRDALRIAADYTARTIEVTTKNPDQPWYGVDFETTIPELISME